MIDGEETTNGEEKADGEEAAVDEGGETAAE